MNDDFAGRYLERVRRKGQQAVVAMEKCARFDRCLKEFPADSKPDVPAVKALLAADGKPGVCNDLTFAGFIMLLGERPEMQIAPGRPDRVPFQTLRFGEGVGAVGR